MRIFSIIFSLIGFQITAHAATLDAVMAKMQSTRADFYNEIYRDLHRNPELSGKEINTARKVAAHLRSLGLEVHEGIGGHGVVGVLKNGTGKIGMLRADMDALPVEEATGLSYSSQVKGVMHACGHDTHTTLLMATAEALIATRDRWNGTLYFLFQPAEENVVGAKAMLDSGLFTRLLPKPDYGLAIHAHASEPTGTVFIRPGDTLASVDAFEVTFIGRGGHGSKPHDAVDPITMGSDYLRGLQKVVAYELDPLKEAVLTVGSFQSGTAPNVIPERAKLGFTTRSFDDDIRGYLMTRIPELARAVATLHRAVAPEVTHLFGAPSVYNDPAIHDRLRQTFLGLSDIKVVDGTKTLGAEDFAWYYKQAGIPTFFYWVGSVNPATPKPWPNAHSSTYAPDFPGFWRTGLKAMTAAVLEMQR